MRKRLVMAIVEARMPLHSAGHRCATLNWLEAFRQLGWDIWIVEDIAAADCVDEAGIPCPPALSINRRAWAEFARLFGFEGRETLFIDGRSPQTAEFCRFARDADLFLNYSGQFHPLDLLDGIRTKAYLDVDPAYTQVWAAGYDCDMNFDGHDQFVTLGAAAGAPDCLMPMCGRDWIPTLPPAPVTLFNSAPPATGVRPWTTVAHWYSGERADLGDLELLPKSDSFLEIIDLPARASVPIIVASDLRPDWPDFAPFTAAGWQLPRVNEVCATLESYRAFITSSAGELGVAKRGYITARTGWMSDRSMVYLSHGRPVIAMDTGWTALVGEHPGLRAFATTDDALRLMREIEADYDAACASARRVAEEIFAGKKIVAQLLERLELACPAARHA
ncbi:MAG: hypothetical protein ACREKL_12505 [Chthoniobacterales bacterium]